MQLRLWWTRVAGIPARWLMRRMSREHPRDEYDGIRLIVADEWLTRSAEDFFSRTRQALSLAASGAPRAYAAFRNDIRQVLLWGETAESAYHRFQLAAVVPPAIALEADIPCYAAWLLHVSGLPWNEAEARARSDDLFRTFETGERLRVARWLAEVTGRSPP